MKSFKDIRSQVNEEYYSGPTSYVGGDKTNVGDIAGSDLVTCKWWIEKTYCDSR